MTWRVDRWGNVPGLVHGFGDRRHPPPDDGVVTLRQVHGKRVVSSRQVSAGEEGDGLVCEGPGERVGVWTADCVPVLMLVRRQRVAAAIHSGWRGTVAGIVHEALARLEDTCGAKPGDVEVALGPSIGGCCYEVGEEVREAFGPDGESGFVKREGRWHLDLRDVLEDELHRSGVAAVERVGPCTACRTDVLCSFRREEKTGRQLSFIGWR